MEGASLVCFKVVTRGVSLQCFSSGYSSFCHCCMGAKVFVWLDRMLHHWVDPTNAMIGGEANDQYMRVPDSFPIHPSRFKPCLWLGNFLLQSSDCMLETSGQSYKHFTLVNYDSRVVIWGIFQSGMTLEL